MKRVFIYKRSIVQLICEILIPVLMVLIGMVMIEVTKDRDSPAFKIGLDYPSNQEIYFNNEVIYDAQ